MQPFICRWGDGGSEKGASPSHTGSKQSGPGLEGAPQGDRAAQGAKVGKGHPWSGEGRLAPQGPVSRLRLVGESPTPLPSPSVSPLP